MQNEELTLNLLRKIENISSQKSIAKELGFSVGKVNYILRALIENGFVKADNFFVNKHKNQYKYLLTREGIEEKTFLTKKFIQRKKAEYEELEKELENIEGI